MARLEDLEGAPRLRFEINNQRAVELSDLTASLSAFADQYRRYLADNGLDGESDRVRLYVAEVRTGSIIADLVSLGDQVEFAWEHRDTLAGFATHLNDIFFSLLGAGAPKPELSKKDLEQISTIVEPVAKDSGSQLNLVANSGGGPIVINLNSQEANTVQRGAERLINRLPDRSDSKLIKDLLVFYQTRADTKSTSGDRGIIEKYSPKPLKVIFMSPEAKKAVLDVAGNIYHQIFVVDGEVEIINGKPVAYKIVQIHETFEKPD